MVIVMKTTATKKIHHPQISGNSLVGKDNSGENFMKFTDHLLYIYGGSRENSHSDVFERGTSTFNSNTRVFL